MMSVSDYIAYLGKSVTFFVSLSDSDIYDELFFRVSGVVTAITIDLDPMKTRFCLDYETEFCFNDCVNLSC